MRTSIPRTNKITHTNILIKEGTFYNESLDHENLLTDFKVKYPKNTSQENPK
jgi:hypothetical protein